MDRYQKFLLTIVLLIGALSLGYYFLWFLPNVTKIQSLQASKDNCSLIQDKTMETFKQKVKSVIIGGGEGTFIASNHYNAKLAKCIVDVSFEFYGGSVRAPDGALSSYSVFGEALIDAQENENIAYCIVNVGTNAPPSDPSLCQDQDNNDSPISKDQFETRKKQYLSE